MAVLDFVLNCACLLLWLNWRSRGFTLPNRPPALALIGTLRRAEPKPRERWNSLIVLIIVLFVRAFLYSQIGSLQWSPQIALPGFVLHFRNDLFGRMLLFSILNFLRMAAEFYFSLLLVAAINQRVDGHEPWTALVRAHLGLVARLPAWMCLLLPFVIAFCAWLAIGPVLAALKIHLQLKSFFQLSQQAALVGLGGWLSWRYVIVTVLILHIISSYVYFGSAPFWNFINVTARHLLRPLEWLPLRLGKIDLVPILALGLVVSLMAVVRKYF
jgi:uncharacterized protein YggT (Ycf19 family)